MSIDNPLWLGTSDVAEKMAVSRRTVLNWHKDGVVVNGTRIHLKMERHGKRHFARRAWLEQFQADLDRASVVQVEKVSSVARRISAGPAAVASGSPAPASPARLG